MRRRHSFTLVLGAVVLSGCYHATVDTGRVPSGQTVEVEWAHGFVYGLVPPSTVEVAQQCPNGIAKVETQLSFLNQVASALTFGIYTPMEISVQCAAPGTALNEAEMTVPANATVVQGREVMTRAAEVAAEDGRAVVVRFLAE
jgi:hypothetical protein